MKGLILEPKFGNDSKQHLGLIDSAYKIQLIKAEFSQCY